MQVGNSVLGYKKIQNQDPVRRDYFNVLYKMKEAIKSLRLSLHDDQAWQQLIEKLRPAKIEPIADDASVFELDEEWEYVPRDSEIPTYLVRLTTTLSRNIYEDELFQSAWQTSLK